MRCLVGIVLRLFFDINFRRFAVGGTTLIIIGTSTVISILLWIANTLDSQGMEWRNYVNNQYSEKITTTVCDYLTKSTGLQVTYENAKGTIKKGIKVQK